MTPVLKPIVIILSLGLAASAQAKLTPAQMAQLPPPASAPVDFMRDIKPILEASCVKCHGRGKEKGGFKLDTRATFLKGGDSGPAALAGRSAESLLIELVSGLDPDNVMPAKGSKLAAAQVGQLRAWIDQGMPWDAGVTFAKPPPVNFHPRQPVLPAATKASGENPIDRLLAGYFAERKIKPTPPVEDRLFARRVYLDVIGLLPPPKELEAFLADTRTDKRPRLVERLLGDNRRYAEHWLGFWNDLLRNDYRGTGYIDGGRKQITPWLFSALATNMPYDRFVAELIHPGTNAEGFVKGIVWRGAVNASQTPEMQAAQNISQVFLGLNLKCASCHDSFINDWALTDAYGLASVFATNAPLEMFQCDKATGKKSGIKFLYPELGEIQADASKVERQKRLAEIMTSPANGRLTRTIVNRLWAKFLGRGLVAAADDMEQPAWNADVLDWLAEDLAAHGHDLKRTMKWILTSRAYQLPSVSLDEQPRADFVFTGPAVRRLSAEQFRDALGSVTGLWFDTAAAQVDLSAGSPKKKDEARLALRAARWIWSDADAAAKGKAETIYLWKTFTLDAVPDEAFVVATCDNSYTLHVNGVKVLSGKEWSQPGFADLRAHLKKGTNVFAVAAVNNTADNKPPAENQPPRAADANAAGFVLYARLRHVGRTLDLGTDRSWTVAREKTTGWEKPGFVAATAQPAAELGTLNLAPWQLENKLVSTVSMADAHGGVRANLVASDPLMTALGRPPREQVATTRPSAATTLQTLELTNGDTLNKALKRGAEKILAGKISSNRELVTGLFLKALGRKPTAKEWQLAAELLGESRRPEQVEDLLWAVAMLPEFQLIY